MSQLEPLAALLQSYEHIRKKQPVKEIAETKISEMTGGCQRCGACCSFMQPGPISTRTYRKWLLEGALIADFFRTLEKGEHPAYHCWYFAGSRLRMCPLMLCNVIDGKTFCAVHHMGSAQRHPACSTYRPNPPLCMATAYSLKN